MTNEEWNRLNPGIPMPHGLREPWAWVQPKDDEELVVRLKQARDLRVHERERENLCAVAAARIAGLKADFSAMLHTIARAQEKQITLERQLAARDRIIRDLTDDAECRPTCDSHGHDADCPVMSAANLLRDLRAQLADAKADAERYRHQAERWHLCFDHLIKHLSHIHMLMWPEPIESDGKRFKFHPPEELVRATWEGLSKAIREIPAAIDAASKPVGDNPKEGA